MRVLHDMDIELWELWGAWGTSLSDEQPYGEWFSLPLMVCCVQSEWFSLPL